MKKLNWAVHQLWQFPKRKCRGGVEDIRYENLVSKENIWRAWKNFVTGKWRQAAVRTFWLNLEKELALLYHDLSSESYVHGPYHHFVVSDTKRRDVYVATVRDKVVHQIVAEYLEKKYRAHFYRHSYAAQRNKGITAARAYAGTTINRLYGHSQVWISKLDVQKYFSNINHEILLKLLSRRITDLKILDLCREIIESFGTNGRGLPLGNLTSQWFANIYLHELDWHAKHVLQIPYYLRYNDDMIIISADRQKVMHWSKTLQQFAEDSLRLTIPPHKIALVGLPESIDILGLVTNGHSVWTRQTTVRKAEEQMEMKYRNLAPELLDAMSSYYGCGINHVFSIANLIA